MLFFARVSQKVVGEVHVFSVYINTRVRSSHPCAGKQNYRLRAFVGLSDGIVKSGHQGH